MKLACRNKLDFALTTRICPLSLLYLDLLLSEPSAVQGIDGLLGTACFGKLQEHVSHAVLVNLYQWATRVCVEFESRRGHYEKLTSVHDTTKFRALYGTDRIYLTSDSWIGCRGVIHTFLDVFLDIKVPFRVTFATETRIDVT